MLKLPWLLVLVISLNAHHKVVAQPLATVSTTYTAGSDNKLLCMAEMVSSIENSCQQNDIQGYYVALEALLKQYLSKCFHTNFVQNRALHEMMPDINEQTTNWLLSEAEKFKVRASLEDVVPTFVPPQQVNAEVEFMLQHHLAISYDGWMLDPDVYGSVKKYGGFFMLDDYVNNPELGLEWNDILPYVRTMHVSFQGRVVALPLDVSVHLLYYRKDVLQARYNSTAPPLTWTQLLAQATALNNTDLNGDGIPDFGICLETRSECGTQVSDLMAIAGSMLQYAGTSQGTFFDPPTLKSGASSAILADNPAMQEALATYVKLAALAPPNSVAGRCDSPSLMQDTFKQGRCAFMLGHRMFKGLKAAGKPVEGNIGVAQLPGSASVLDRATNLMVPCTRQLCPYAITDQNGTVINMAPFNAEGGWVLSINQKSPTNNQNATLEYHAFMIQPNKSWDVITNPAFEFEPYRQQHLTNLERWVGAGYDPNDTSQWLAALGNAMDMSGSSSFVSGGPGLGRNMVMDLRVPGTKFIRELYAYAVSNATLGVSIANVTSTLATATIRLLQDSQKIMATLVEVADAYHGSVGYLEPPAPPAQLAGPAAKSGGSPSWLPIAIILPVVGVLLLVSLGVVYEVRNKRKHKDVWGNALPPKAAADTTVLYMAVQDMDGLSDLLSSEVLNACLNEYWNHANAALQHHSGYMASQDVATGVCVMAFHSPKDAMLAALEMQQSLLNAAWPAELLALPMAAPMHVLPPSTELPEASLTEILDANDPAVQMYTPATTTRGPLLRIASQFLARKDPLQSQTPAVTDFGGDGGDYRLALAAAPAGPTIPALMHVPTSETYTFATACQRAWKEAKEPTANSTGKVLIFRGLRVRMGIHVGVSNPDWVTVAKDDPKKMQYSGPPVQLVTAIANAAQGGMILLSEDTYKKLPLERLWDRHLVIHVGEHPSLDSAPGPINLYHALNRSMEGRLAHLGPLISPSPLEPGVLDAPVGCVTVAFMNVVGAQTLLSWNADVAQSALKLFHTVVGEELKARGGYLVEAVDGLFLSTFTSPFNAILWSLECNDLIMKQDWPETLLAHELCEELVISSPTRDGDVMHSVVFRGLRLKTGVDTGQVLGEVHAMTGRMTYRGKVMNRAARIASTASTGQVLCSNDSWEIATARNQSQLQQCKITASSLGHFRLKGVAERIEIQHCRRAAVAGKGRRTSSLLLSIAQRWNWDGAAPEGAAPEVAVTQVDLSMQGDDEHDGLPRVGVQNDEDNYRDSVKLGLPESSRTTPFAQPNAFM